MKSFQERQTMIPHPLRLVTVLAVAAATLYSASLPAADMPKRKSGLWQISTSTPNMPGGGMAMQQCIDEKTDDVMGKAGAAGAQMKCSRQDMKRDNDRVIVDSVCDLGGTTATTHAIFTGKFDSNYRAEIRSSYNPPMGGMKEGSVTIEAKWLGACKAGQKPGDMVMPNGMTVNPGNMPKQR
jgi:hypothetical protein